MSQMKQIFVYLLITFCQYCFDNVRALMEVHSLQMVPCVNKLICDNGINLRIVLNESIIESSAGSGTISVAFTAGQEWIDSFGHWKLDKALDIQIKYDNALWEYQLVNEGQFWSQQEQNCANDACGVEAFHVCGEEMALTTFDLLTKYSIEDAAKWEANVLIQSSAISIDRSVNDMHDSILENNFEIYMEPVFDTTTCYQDLGNLYYVVANKFDYYYWTSKHYWQDARNNFNISKSTYLRDFDCNFEWDAWHTIIPFFNNTDQYYQIERFASIRNWREDQLYMWKEGLVKKRWFNSIMTNCTDLTTYPRGETRHPLNNSYKVRKFGMIDRLQMILDLDHRLFVNSLPTTDPTLAPTQSPTLAPTQSPTFNPVSAPTRTPSRSPTVCIDNNPWEYYETAAEIEITSTSVIDISSSTVLTNITGSLALGLDIGREYIRLDFAEYMTSVSRRRLQTNTQILILGFTVFASTEDEKTMLKEKLEETITYYHIDSALSDKFPEIIFIFISGTMDECEAGTKLRTVAGERKCESICAVNHYYETGSSACKEQVEFSPMIIIKRNYLVRILFFIVGVIAWVATLGLGYAVYKCYKNKLQSGSNVKSSDTKSNIKSTHDAENDFEDSEYSSTNEEDYSTTNDSSSPNSSSTSSS